ncbi:hypothetical protein [Komagataeibacter kakiaceti]|uniref:hypothetical protein n=1 Tax=Komagataeibacter kakiaceti TaxID=943261 RepID=UPI0011DDDA82|nr:hypothetical protein [Komagataeibacter kakiaceti]
MKWGLLGPEQLAGARRTRTLDLGAAVRTFNELAVPGLGGVWFAKQIFLATLGVHLADRLRATRPDVRPIKIANTIEALACLCAFKNNKWAADARLRGLQKLPRDGKLTFSRLGLSRFYVTQPMRMATGEALAALGFVAPGSQRFNSFQCAKAGLDLIDAATRCFKPHNGTVEGYLYKCAMARDEPLPQHPRSGRRSRLSTRCLPARGTSFEASFARTRARTGRRPAGKMPSCGSDRLTRVTRPPGTTGRMKSKSVTGTISVWARYFFVRGMPPSTR